LKPDLQHVATGRSVPDEQYFVIAAGNELPRAGARAVAHHRVEVADDVRMAQLPGERGLVQELRAVHGAELRVAEHLGLDRLERHFPSGEGVLGEIDGPRGSLAEELLHVVFPDLER
jgi:hypothetical protein